MANLGGFLKKKFGPKKFFGAFASPFFFCLQSGKKHLAKIKIKIIGLVDSYESFQKYPIVPIPASMFIKNEVFFEIVISQNLEKKKLKKNLQD
jgi:hypothetical protein